MKPVTNLRIAIIAVVTVLSIWLTIPTVRYYVHLKDQKTFNPILKERPEGATPPSETDKIKYAEWKTQNPELAAWYAKNAAAAQWGDEDERLRLHAIPLGLDLLGGVDIVLTVDKNKAVTGEVDRLRMNILDLLDRNKITASADMIAGQPAFTFKLTNTADARKAANLLEKEGYAKLLTGDLSEKSLAAGPVTCGLTDEQIREKLSGTGGTMEGVRKAISDRVNALGVTQPRVSRVGEDKIRVQVPGVKDPEKLIKTVIKPADLEFRLVDKRYGDLFSPPPNEGGNGKLIPGKEIPPGTKPFPARFVKFVNGQPTAPVDYQILLADKPVLTGADIRSASVSYDSTQMEISVDFVLSPNGAKQFAKVTTDNVGRGLAIVLDGVVRSHPNIKTPITAGRGQITGGFSNEEAMELSQIIKAGALPAPLEIESQQEVGATLGADSIASGVRALVIGTVVVSVFMIVYYGTAGVISIFALVLNVLIILSIMALSRATLTLSGIGGILLTIGMAVDANVLIYERIREEVDNGRPMRQAISLGFNRAFTVILDSNLTTLLTALVLLQFTEGSVFGFALTMTFGLIANLFTGLTVTYTICALWFNRFGHLTLGKLRIFHNPSFDFIGMRKFSLFGSQILILICIGIVFGAQGGFKMGVDFAGGMRQEVAFKNPVRIEDIRKAISLPDARVQTVAAAGKVNTYLIDVGLIEASDTGSALSATAQALDQQLSTKFSTNGQPDFQASSTQGFGRETASGFTGLALTVVVLSAIAIGIYLWFRFELAFGVAAVIALVHDLTLVALLCSLWKVQISLDAVAAFMVLMGFSVNDTIVIFDRIRENTRAVYGKNFGELCNLSMNQSLSRTIITSGTVFLAALVLLLVGGESLGSFAKIIVVGAVIGTYSSDFIAAPLVYEWNKYKGNRLAVALASKKNKVEAAKPVGRPGSRQQ